MIRSYTTEQIRAAERAALAQTSDGALMHRAAWAVARAVLRRVASPRPGRSVVLLVGPGHNGGDALYAGALLRRRGMAVTALLTDPARAHPGGLAALQRAGGRWWQYEPEFGNVPGSASPVAKLMANADVMIDGLVGIGVRPPLREPMAGLVSAASQSPALRVAVDVPSGIDPNTGVREGPAFAADLTVTIGGVKTGLLLSDAAGLIDLAPIGMDPAVVGSGGMGADGTGVMTNAVYPDPVAYTDTATRPDVVVYTDVDVARLMPGPGHSSDKYSGGVPGIVAGSPEYPGAAVLAVGGAVRLRPGLVRYVGPQAAAVIGHWPEVVVGSDIASAGRIQAWGIGPGIGTDGVAVAAVREVLAGIAPVVLDADALTVAARLPGLLAGRVRRDRQTVLTPHAGEFARLFPDLDLGDRLTAVRAAARRIGCVVLLKGRRTIIASPEGSTVINLLDSPWLATAGSGDVLLGIMTSLLAAGLDAMDAAGLAAYLHGRAGQRAEIDAVAGASALLPRLAPTSRPPEVRRDVRRDARRDARHGTGHGGAASTECGSIET